MRFRPTAPSFFASNYTTKMTTYNINITSDIVCPWCYIGHTRLNRAIQSHQKQFPTDKFNLSYRPFYLNPPPQLRSSSSNGPIPPPFPAESRPRREVYAEKFGAERAKGMEARMAQISADEGLNFKFGGMTGRSRNGHRLVHFAQTHGGEQAQNDVMLGLWRRYFEQEVDITRLDVLVDIGVEAGLGSKEEVKAFLESGADGEEVDRLAEESRMDGISGVPYYVIQDMWAVSGAQEPTAFEMLFKRYKQMEAKNVSNAQKDKVGGNGNGCL